MGRKKKVTTREKQLKKNDVKENFIKNSKAISFDISMYIILTYLILSIGFLFRPIPSILINIIPWVMVITSVFVIYRLRPNRFLFTIILLITALTFILQAIAVLTGIPFGEFFYTNVLGPRIMDVSIVIAINWSMIILCAYVFTQQLVEKIKIDQRFIILITPIIVTLIDYIMEPVAMYLRFWIWKDIAVPASNYISWFLFSLLCTVFIYFITWGKKINNSKYLLAFLIGQAIFFTVINILIIR